MVLSVIVALVPRPALAATLLKRQSYEDEPRRAGWTAAFRPSAAASRRPPASTAASPPRRALSGVRPATWSIANGCSLLIYAGIAVAAGRASSIRLPTSFLPAEDQGAAQVQFTLPPGATQARTLAVGKEIENYFLTRRSATSPRHVHRRRPAAAGRAPARMPAAASSRCSPGTSARAARTPPRRSPAARPRAARRALRDVAVLRAEPAAGARPRPVERLHHGAAEHRRPDPPAVQGGARPAAGAGRAADPVLAGVRPERARDMPTLQVDIDQAKVGALGVTQARRRLPRSPTAWGGSYVNDFVDRGRVKRVYRAGRRALPQPARRISATGTSAPPAATMAPFSAFAQHRLGARRRRTLSRFNGVSVLRDPGPGGAGPELGRGDGPDGAARRPAARASRSTGAGLSYQERLSGGQAPYLYAHLAARRLPVPRRALRELVDPVRR